jgi:hypothetical protein
MTAQEIEDALMREEMAEDAFFAEPSPANKIFWEKAPELVDRAIEEVA